MRRRLPVVLVIAMLVLRVGIVSGKECQGVNFPEQTQVQPARCRPVHLRETTAGAEEHHRAPPDRSATPDAGLLLADDPSGRAGTSALQCLSVKRRSVAVPVPTRL